MLRGMAAMLGIVALAACDRRAPIDSCDQNLAGTWTSPSGRWMVIDNGRTLEIYPLFDDSVPEGAPRLIDLRRDGKLAGELKRRFMRRAAVCEAYAPVRVTACKSDALQLVIGEVTSPLGFEPCTWPQQAPTRVEQWRRQ
jgi:hypothetical protein